MNARLIILATTTLTGLWAVINLPFWPAFITGWVALVIIAFCLTPEPRLEPDNEPDHYRAGSST